MPKKLPHSQPSLRPAYIALGLGCLLAVIGIVSQISFKPTSETTTTPTKQMSRIETTAVIFYSKIFMKRDQTYIAFPFKFTESPQPLRLSLAVVPEAPAVVRTVFHPLLADIPWSKIETTELALYQRHPQYTTVADFVANPPTGRLAADDYLTKLPQYAHLPAVSLDTLENLDTIDYIFTTYRPLQSEDGAYYYENVVDASNAQVGDNQELMWVIEAPKNHPDNPFYIGEIHVDYRQY